MSMAKIYNQEKNVVGEMDLQRLLFTLRAVVEPGVEGDLRIPGGEIDRG